MRRSSPWACESLLVTFCASSWSFHRSGWPAWSSRSAISVRSAGRSDTASMLSRVLESSLMSAAASAFTTLQATR